MRGVLGILPIRRIPFTRRIPGIRSIPSLIVAFIGACILVAILHLIRGEGIRTG